MANILTYFEKNEEMSAKEGLEIYDFTGDPEIFMQDCIDRFREAYISEKKIEKILSSSKTETRHEIIKRRLPTMTKNKAGDFGEIISYYLWTETWGADSTIRPFKWRWKENPDMSSHLVDVILLKRIDEHNANISDKMYTIESKVWTSAMREGKSSLTEALQGAQKDEIERAAKTIPYLVIQYQRDDDYVLADQVKRFGDPVTMDYQKVHCAIAIVDSKQTEMHIKNFDKGLHKATPHIPVYYLPISKLREIYMWTYDKLPNS